MIGGIMKCYFLALLILAIGSASAFAANPPYVHEASDVRVDIASDGRVNQIKWPKTTGQNMLYFSHGLDFLIAHENVVSNDYGLNPNKVGNNSFSEKTGQFSQRSVVNVLSKIGALNKLEVEQSVFTFASKDGFAGQDSLIEIKYRITNKTGGALQDIYFGSYFDLQPSFGGGADIFGYSKDADMIYWKISDTEYAGIRTVSKAAHSVHFKLYGGPITNQTFTLITDGVKDDPSVLTPSDYTAMVSVSAGTINPNVTYTYTVALFFAKTLEELKTISNTSYARNGGLGEGGGVTVVKENVVDGSPVLDSTSPSSGGGCLIKK